MGGTLWKQKTSRTVARIHREIIPERSGCPGQDSVAADLEQDILESEVKWALESMANNKASGGDSIPDELFEILKDDAVKVLHSICQQIWKTQQWPENWKRSVYVPITKKDSAKE